MSDSEVPSASQAPHTSAAPPIPPVSSLRARVEAIVLVVDAPVQVGTIARALEEQPTAVLRVLEEIRAEFDERGSGFDLRSTSEGWRMYTRPEHAQAVESFLLDGTQTRLSRAALETLAIVAYRQPVTRGQVSAVRGVNVDGVMRTLLARGLVAEAGEEPSTGAHLYTTTELFLDQLGIESLDRLPDLAPLLPDVDLIDEL